MIYTHYPAEFSWQLLEKPVSPAAAENLPKYRGEYFLYGLEPIEGLRKVTRCGESYTLEFPVPEDTYLSSYIVDMQGRSYDNATLVQSAGGTASIHIKFPEAGRWEVIVFARKNRAGGSYESVLEAGFEAGRGSGTQFPVLYSSFIDDNGYLYSPLDDPLYAGRR
jgi:hypothetical protein